MITMTGQRPPSPPRCCSRSLYRESKDGKTERCRNCGDTRPVEPRQPRTTTPTRQGLTAVVLAAAMLGGHRR